MRLPYARSKRYLKGMDWFVNAFNCMTEQATGVGNLCQVVIKLDGHVDENLLRDHLPGFLSRFPVLKGHPSRDLNLAPYWKYQAKDFSGVPVELTAHALPEGAPLEEVISWIRQFVNRPFSSRKQRLRFAVTHVGPRRSYVSMVFDHRLFDARGAEAFLDLFQQSLSNPELKITQTDVTPVEPAHLDDWTSRFKSGQQVNRAIRALAQSEPRLLPLPDKTQGVGYDFDVIPLTEAQTKGLCEAADREAGYLMLMPYGLALAFRVVHRLFSARGLKGSDYVVPVAIEARTPGQTSQELFFKHVTFLTFIAKKEEIEEPGKLLQVLTGQFYDQVKNKLPQHFENASLLIRICPVAALGPMARAGLGRWVSFCFSFVSETGYEGKTFAGIPILNLFHTPRVPLPPGLGLFFNRYGDRMNAIITRLDGLLSAEEAVQLRKDLQSLLENR